MATNREAFIAALLPAAIEASKRTGIDPRIIIAQAAQETGWGRSAPGNNYFGIKSHGQGGGQTFTTHEVIDGKRVKVKDSFRQYASPADSVEGYAEFILRNPRYKDFRGAQGLDAQLAELQESGYATDPNYSRSVGQIARSISVPGSMAPSPSSIAAAQPAAPPQAPGTPAPPMGPGQNIASIPEPQPIKSPVNIPAPVLAAAQNSPSPVANMASILGSMAPNPPTPQHAPAQFQGPSPQQANALSSFIAALKQQVPFYV